jgi:hypothetical protein
MTPMKKARELVDKFRANTTYNNIAWGEEHGAETHNRAKRCAIIAIDEIMTFVPYGAIKETVSPYDGAELSMDYWQEVKDEINKL